MMKHRSRWWHDIGFFSGLWRDDDGGVAVASAAAVPAAVVPAAAVPAGVGAAAAFSVRV
jgi:hypothetical protein